MTDVDSPKGLLERAGSICLAAALAACLMMSVGMRSLKAEDASNLLSGIWWNSSEAGWGLAVTQQGPVAFAAWYTYTADGLPTWYVVPTCEVSTTGCAGDLFAVRGGSPVGTGWNSPALSTTRVGRASLSIVGSESARWEYELNGSKGSKTISRYRFAASGPTPSPDYSAVWWNEREAGWGVTLTQQFGTVFAVVYTYDASGRATWYTVTCAIASNACTGPALQVTGGSPPDRAWSPNLQVRTAGEVAMAFASPDSFTLRTSIDSAAGTAPLTRFLLPSAPVIEQSQGSLLERPVFQCGRGTDTVTAEAAPNSVTVFESGPVRPIALASDGARLYVTNTPANCLEIYAVEGDSLRLASSVAVGLEPVSVAERSANELWVVNHLSDSVSIVRLDGTPRVLRTLQVGDEPRDIVFAGPQRDRAFVTAAFRGQNRPGFTDANLTTPGTGRADVWVFDASRLGDTLNGAPISILTLFAEVPRGLATSPDGRTVYAAPFMSGNRTTVLERNAVLGNKPGPTNSVDGAITPATGLIVKNNGSAWLDETGRNWAGTVRFTLPDYDLFAIDAMATPPRATGQLSGIGTTLFNIAVHPQTSRVYVSNTDALNHIRFEGSGARGTTVRGRIAESRITVVDPASGAVDAVHLNSHVDFSTPQGQSILPTEKAKSLAQPMAMVFSPGGETLYVAAFGSAKVAALPTANITAGRFTPDASHHIAVPDGPVGLALNASGTRLFVYSRIAQRLSVVDTTARRVLSNIELFTPESRAVIEGRKFLYDANLSSANGTSSCASCHIFADMDHLSWDLGNPDDGTANNPNAYVNNSLRTTFRFHPLKGPMSTQTLRGMVGNGPLHWRGDRTGTNRKTVRGQLETLEAAAFKEFNPAFVSLLGRERELTENEMQAFTDFAMALAVPPNPVRNLDNSLTTAQAAGRNIYFNVSNITGTGSCHHCHALTETNGDFGTNGLMSFEGLRITENFKIPQLRNVYQKAGMYGIAANGSTQMGPQIRGFGFGHDGAIDSLNTFFGDGVFNFPAPAATTRAQVIAFTMAMDTDFLPVVGQQVSWRPGASAEIESRVSLLKQQAAVTSPRAACDLVVKGSAAGQTASGLLQRDGTWLMRGGARLGDAELRALASATHPLTFTCVPPGAGRRIGLDQP